MKILALETATLAGSIAIFDDAEGLISEVRVNLKIAHSERLMPSIQWLLEASRMSIGDIDAFSLSIGPGSFTGLRIGLSTVKGLSYATRKPVVAVPTLEAFARMLPYCAYMICPMFDARKKQVYAALFRWEKRTFRKVMDETAVAPHVLLKEIREPVVFMGEGAKLYKNQIMDALGENALFAPEAGMSPSASPVAEIGAEKIRQGETADPVALTPLYIRKSEAEIRWKG
jgi:tRNA threonylcarbamoyladenosine biosynthesis protein TsaB